jgi:hypothetical protein
MWWGQVPQPSFHGNGTYHDVRDGIRFVKDRERFAQRGAVFDLGISERPASRSESCLSDHLPGREPYSTSNQLGVMMDAFGSKER